MKLEALADPVATEADYAALNEAIEAIILGFDKGEYAPYNNLEAMPALSAAKAIGQTDPAILQKDVQDATTALKEASWNANTAEVNAIFDGSFEHDYSGQSGHINPIGWQRVKGAAADGYNVRLMNGTNAGLSATSSKKALFTKQSAYYGFADGYTMPLKANTKYKISFVYGGWGDCKNDGYVSMTAPDGSAVELSTTNLPIEATNADASADAWKSFTAIFTTTDAGNYVLGLRKKNNDTSGQSQYVYGDIKLFRATADDFKADLLAEIESTDATSNVGKSAFQIPEAAAATLSSAVVAAQSVYDATDASVDAVLQATDKLKSAKEVYSNVELNAPKVGQLFNIVNVTDNFKYYKKALTFKSSIKADFTTNSTSMGWSEYQNSRYPQAVNFTPVEGVKNGYIISYTRADGTDIYLSTGKTSGFGDNTSQIRPTTDPSKALTVIVSVFDSWRWNLLNTEAGQNLGSNEDEGLYTANGKNADLLIEEAKECRINDIEISVSNQYATLIIPFDAAVPSGVTAYSVDAVNNKEVNLQTVTELKANTPYVLYAESGFTGSLSGIGAAFTETSYTAGLLTGTYADIDAPNGSYVLQNQSGNVAFYLVDTESATPKVKANHAYLTAPATGARALYFGGEATAIGALKALTNGEAEVYNLNGRRQTKLQKGVNIVKTKDGRTQKVMVK